MTARRMLNTALTTLLLIPASFAAERELHQVIFPEGQNVDIEFTVDERAPRARLNAEVRHKRGQAEIDLSYDDMKPAVLFGGDVTSYVLWAVTRDAKVENLGELWVRKPGGNHSAATGLKAFALVVTAESHPLVPEPSDLVLFSSNPVSTKTVRSTPFQFSNFGPAPPSSSHSVAMVEWSGKKPLDLLQAEKAYELAEREGAQGYVPQIMKEATIALAQARNLATTSHGKEIRDFCRRTVALSSEAIRTTQRHKEREQIEREIEQRRAEMAELEGRAETAEAATRDARDQLAEVERRTRDELAAAELEREEAARAIAVAQGQLERLAGERALVEAERDSMLRANEALQLERSTLLAERDRIASEKAALEAEQSELFERQQALQASIAEMGERAAILKRQKDELASMLESALSQVANTTETARGMIVSLPDILFDSNQATLKNEAKVVIAKLSGILLIMKDLNLRIEGHTDSRGSEEYNQSLSESRAETVRVFLTEQGLAETRISSFGYGEGQPVADNETSSGRSKNRRVEIIIAKGEIGEAMTATETE